MLTIYTSMTCLPGRMSLLEVSLIMLPIDGIKSPKPPFWGREYAFSSQTCRLRVDGCLPIAGGSLFADGSVKLDTHYPCTRAVFTGVQGIF